MCGMIAVVFCFCFFLIFLLDIISEAHGKRKPAGRRKTKGSAVKKKKKGRKRKKRKRSEDFFLCVCFVTKRSWG